MFISPSILLCGKNCLPSSEMLRDLVKRLVTLLLLLLLLLLYSRVLDQNRTPLLKCMSSNFCLKTVSWSFEIEDFTFFDCSFASTSFLLEVRQTIWENNKTQNQIIFNNNNNKYNKVRHQPWLLKI
jgi:hypothetical protein